MRKVVERLKWDGVEKKKKRFAVISRHKNDEYRVKLAVVKQTRDKDF